MACGIISMRLSAAAAALFSASTLLALLNYSATARGAEPIPSDVSYSIPVPAEFRGCKSARKCRFRILSSTSLTESLLVVQPDGVSAGRDGGATDLAVRNRLNALMSNMIHQHKRIELQDLRKLDDGIYGATVKVNGMELSADPILKDLMETLKH